jgi:hypothetical protein
VDVWELIQENGLISILIGVVVIFLVISLVKNMLKLALFAVAVGAILILVFDFTPESVIDMGEQGVEKVNEITKTHIQPIVEKEWKDADISKQEDGSYLIQTASVTLQWKKGEDVAIVTYKEETFEMDTSAVKDLLNEAIATYEAETSAEKAPN